MKKQFIFENTTAMYIMADITNKHIIDRLDERRKYLLLGHLPLQDVLHLTLLQLEINQDHPLASYFQDQTFHKKIAEIYKLTMQKDNVVLQSVPGSYDLYGQTENKYYVKLLEPDQKLSITRFRKTLYHFIREWLGPYTIYEKQKYYVFQIHNIDLFAVPDFYYGVGIWSPHISIVNTADIRKYNYALYENYTKQETKEEKMNILLQSLQKATHFKPLTHIKMADHCSVLSISLKNYKTNLDLRTEIKI